MYMKACQKWDKQKPTPSTGFHAEFLVAINWCMFPIYFPPVLKDHHDTDGVPVASIHLKMVPVARFGWGLGIDKL